MRKLFFAAAMLLLSQVGFGQAVNDQAVIPVSVTLNSILRLTVVSGGNIEFVVNTINQYSSGINNNGGDARYQTRFTVSSSRDFDVTLRAEDAQFNGQDDAAHNMSLDNVGFDLTVNGTGVDGTNWNLPATTLALSNASQTIVTGIANNAAGSAAQNDFNIRWRLGTGEPNMNTSTLLAQNIPADRYVTNVFLELVPK